MPDYVECDVPVAAIDAPERPSRLVIDPEALGRLADDIAANGLHQRIGVHAPDPDCRYGLIFGHRRLLAFRLLRRTMIPAKLYPRDADAQQIRMAENEMRENLNPIEQALEARAFVDRGEPLAGVARRFRRSPAWVTERIALLDYPEDLQTAIANGWVGLAVAAALAQVDHAPYRAQLVTEARLAGASERSVAVWVAQYLADAPRIKANTITVDEILARREEFRVVARCPGCEQDHDFGRTRAIRFCEPCAERLLALLAEAPPAAS